MGLLFGHQVDLVGINADMTNDRAEVANFLTPFFTAK